MRCELCGRRMQSHWSHGRAYHRCKYRDDYPGGDLGHPKNVFVQETAIVPGLDDWIASLFDEDHIDQTCATLAGVSEPDPEILRREDEIRGAIADCDRKLKNYRALLDAEGAVSVAVEWISETQTERKRLERQLGQRVHGGELTAEEVKTLVTELKRIVDVLAGADAVDKGDLYDKLGISLSYDPSGRVSVSAHARGPQDGVGGGSGPAGTPTVRWALGIDCTADSFRGDSASPDE
jgi:site-specific DNA recombinase